MRKRAALAVAAALAAWLTFGLVDAAMHLERLYPPWSYAGFFQRVLLAMERAWSSAHGWPSWSHLEGFGRFYARAVPFGCALGGFGLFLLLARGRPRSPGSRVCTLPAGTERASSCTACAGAPPFCGRAAPPDWLPARHLWKIPALSAVSMVPLPALQGMPYGWQAWAEAFRTALVVAAMARSAGEKYLQYRRVPGHSVS